MPYLDQTTRVALDRNRDRGLPAFSVGELNYIITKEALRFIDYNGMSYATINAAIGALECAKLELYRRLAAPYEDTKIQENGDVYP